VPVTVGAGDLDARGAADDVEGQAEVAADGVVELGLGLDCF
jgi:hypothetical protein